MAERMIVFTYEANLLSKFNGLISSLAEAAGSCKIQNVQFPCRKHNIIFMLCIYCRLSLRWVSYCLWWKPSPEKLFQTLLDQIGSDEKNCFSYLSFQKESFFYLYKYLLKEVKADDFRLNWAWWKELFHILSWLEGNCKKESITKMIHLQRIRTKQILASILSGKKITSQRIKRCDFEKNWVWGKLLEAPKVGISTNIIFTLLKHYIHNFNSYVENITRARVGRLKNSRRVESM